MERELPAFHKYTEIESYYRYPDAIPAGTPVRITEKIHGTNCRVGRIYDGEWRFMGGSHKTTRKPYDAAGKPSLYWRPLMDDNVQSLLRSLCGEKHNVIVFGELFGPGIQDLDYGQQEVAFRVFDISVDGVYLNWHSVQEYCRLADVPTVPLLYVGDFDPAVIEQYVHGPTTFTEVKSKFKGREGIVITPLRES